MSESMSNPVSIVWKYMVDGSVKTHLDDNQDEQMMLYDYIESLFDLENINYDERSYLLENLNNSPLGHMADSNNGVIVINFPCFVKYNLQEQQKIKYLPSPSVELERSDTIKPVIFQPNPPPTKRAKRYHISFICNENKKLWNCAVKSEDSPIILKTSDISPKNSTEVIFLVDGTQSMANEISTIRRTCGRFAQSIASTGSEVRFGLVAYGIAGENFSWKKKMPQGIQKKYRSPTSRNTAYCTVAWPLTSAEKFQAIVEDEMRIGIAGRKGCYFPGAGSLNVLYDTMKIYSKLDNSVNRYIVHISDEYDKTNANADQKKIIQVCNSNDIVMHIWGCDTRAHREVANKTGGSWWPIDKTLGPDEFDTILHSISETIAEAVTLKSTDFSSPEDDFGPRCIQYNSSPASEFTQGENSRGTKNTLNDNEGYVAIDNFECMYCQISKYFVCQSCGEHNCRSGETTSPDQKYTSEANCGKCGTFVRIREEYQVQSSTSTMKGKKGSK